MVLDAAVRAAWDASAAVLVRYIAAHPHTALLGRLYRRLGAECGSVMRCLAGAGVCWGTFADTVGMHCNAHSNNFVVVLGGGSGTGFDDDEHDTPDDSNNDDDDAAAPLLAPLDFDLAYTRAAADRDCSEYLAHEPPALANDLAMDPYSTGTRNDHVVAPETARLHWALRDTLVHSYIAALSSAADAGLLLPAWAAGERDAAIALLRLAVITTRDVVA